MKDTFRFLPCITIYYIKNVFKILECVLYQNLLELDGLEGLLQPKAFCQDVSPCADVLKQKLCLFKFLKATLSTFLVSHFLRLSGEKQKKESSLLLLSRHTMKKISTSHRKKTRADPLQDRFLWYSF